MYYPNCNLYFTIDNEHSIYGISSEDIGKTIPLNFPFQTFT